jgi:hypothetical protein
LQRKADSQIRSSGVVGIRSIKTMIPTFELDQVGFPEFLQYDETSEVGDGVRLAQTCMLEEILGAVFGSITLWYLVSSIAAMA